MLDKKLIPPGSYCYLLLDVTDDSPSRMRCLVCPYWSLREDKPSQDNGYCEFLEEGDWESEHCGLLWDQVKECGENDEGFINSLHKPESCFGKEQEWLKYMLEQNRVPPKLVDLVELKISEL